jgi:hypothetical protein
MLKDCEDSCLAGVPCEYQKFRGNNIEQMVERSKERREAFKGLGHDGSNSSEEVICYTLKNFTGFYSSFVAVDL